MSTSTEISATDNACARASGGERATWVYAVSRDVDQTALTGLRGIGGGQIRTLVAGLLTAVVESVDPVAFSAEKLQDRLSDPAELEAIARRHHEVVVAVTALGPALPLRLATVYLSDDGTRDLLSQRSDEFCQTLGWLADRTECGIRAFADPAILRRDHPAPEPSSRGPADHSGAAYLSRRRAELAARAEGQHLAARCGEEIHAALDRLAVASHLHPLHDADSAGVPDLEVLNAAYLVESASLPEFAESAKTAAAQAGAVRIVVTGPWPAYSFAHGWTAVP